MFSRKECKRKECKRKARETFRRHYILFMFLCFIAAVIGTEYSESYGYLMGKIKTISGIEEKADGTEFRINDAITNVLTNKESSKKIIDELLNREKKQPSQYIGKHIEIGHFNGVLAGVINNFTSGAFVLSILSALCAALGSATAAVAIFIFLSFLVIFLTWTFFINVYKVVYVRMFTEGRLYKYVPMRRAAFLIYVGKWGKAALTMLVKSVYYCLWMLTGIGGAIKFFSYFAVPYIVAENPDLRPNQAITLSRKMMQGHKWECFKIYFTFIGWNILDAFTWGLSGILYSNPYKEATFCEYYAYIRKCAKDSQIEGVQALRDTYLYELPIKAVLKNTYGTIEDYKIKAEYEEQGWFNKLCDFFGIYFREDGNKKYKEYLSQKSRYDSVKNILENEEYGMEFLPFTVKKHSSRSEYLQYTRRYSVWSLILLYAIFSFIGWVWEVTLHLVQDGAFVNRGVLHGPWLPIYGTGGILILLILNKLRNKPMIEFFSAIVLCGIVEYFVGWNLELTHGGQKWWDYQGSFINIDGRVCAEGLLVFGLGGMAIVYFVAPMLDNLIRKIPKNILIIICAVFLTVFIADKVYSSYQPNTGKGITSFNIAPPGLQEKPCVERILL